MGLGLGLVDGFALCRFLACIAAQSLAIENPPFLISLYGGVRRGRGVAGGGANGQHHPAGLTSAIPATDGNKGTKKKPLTCKKGL